MEAHRGDKAYKLMLKGGVAEPLLALPAPVDDDADIRALLDEFDNADRPEPKQRVAPKPCAAPAPLPAPPTSVAMVVLMMMTTLMQTVVQ